MKKYIISEAISGANKMVLTREEFSARYVEVRKAGGWVMIKGTNHLFSTCEYDKNRWSKYANSFIWVHLNDEHKTLEFKIAEELMNGY